MLACLIANPLNKKTNEKEKKIKFKQSKYRFS